jgi:hypothetical protein
MAAQFCLRCCCPGCDNVSQAITRRDALSTKMTVVNHPMLTFPQNGRGTHGAAKIMGDDCWRQQAEAPRAHQDWSSHGCAASAFFCPPGTAVVGTGLDSSASENLLIGLDGRS